MLMNQLKTKAIVLSRRNYRETDRIITVLTPNYGKLTLIARGVRVMKSKLAGGVELFTLNDISFIRGRGEMSTLVSGRMDKNFPNIITDINRVREGYELLKTIDKTTEDEAEEEYFQLLLNSLEGLNDLTIGLDLIRLWFMSRLIAVSGHEPNLATDLSGNRLQESSSYGFDPGVMTFTDQNGGKFSSLHIKFLRIAFAANSPQVLNRINGANKLTSDVLPLITSIRQMYLDR